MWLRALLLLVVASACATSQPEPVMLDVVMADDWADTAPVLDVVRAFEASNPGVTVNVAGRPFSQIPDELAAAVAAGRSPDVVQSHAFEAGAKGLAEPLDDVWIDTLDATDFYPGAIDDVTWGETFYGVPLDINAMFLILDAELAGQLSEPTTFEETRAFVRQVSTDGHRGMTISSSSWQAYGWIRANGGEIVEVAGDGTPQFTLDRDANVEALDFLASLVDDGVAHGPTTRGLADDAVGLFAAGDTAVLTSGTWATTALANDFSDRDFVTAPMPRGAAGDTAGSALGGSSLLVGRGSDARELAIEFMLALTESEVALELARTEGRLPPRPDLMAQTDLDPRVGDTLRTQLASAHPERLIAFPEAEEAFSRAIDEVLAGRQGAATALGEAQRIAEASQG